MNATDDDVDYSYNRQMRGEVVGLKKMSGANQGEPDSVVLQLKTQDGQTREVKLGDVGYARSLATKFKTGDQVAIGGREVQRNGKTMVKAEEIRAQGSVYDIPEYEYNRTIRGELTGIKRVKTSNGDVEAVIANVQDSRGNTRSIILGSMQDLGNEVKNLKPNSEVTVTGYKREVGGESTFVVQDVMIRDRAQQDSGQAGQPQHAEPAEPLGRSEQPVTGRDSKDPRTPPHTAGFFFAPIGSVISRGAK